MAGDVGSRASSAARAAGYSVPARAQLGTTARRGAAARRLVVDDAGVAQQRRRHRDREK